MARQRKARLLPWALSPSAAAESLNIPLRLIMNAIYRDATLEAYLINNRVRIPVDCLLAWVKSHPRVTILKWKKGKCS